MNSQSSSLYSNTEIKHLNGGRKMVRKVVIRNGKGYKSISIRERGKKSKTIRRKVCSEDISKIHNGVFIPGLFRDCVHSRSRSKSVKR